MKTCACLMLLAALGAAEAARADPPGPSATSSTAAAAPAPYSLPFGLRPVTSANVVRFDWVLAFSDNPAAEEAVPGLLLISYKLLPDLAVIGRMGVVSATPKLGSSGTALTNLALAGNYSLAISPELRAGLFLGLTLPVGSGGGNSPVTATRQAVLSGIPARSAMDNALFAVNYLTIFPGAGLAFTAHGLTLQAETTLLALIRARGELVDKDASRINWTAGLHLGYFLDPRLSVATELRYQRWLKNDTVNAVADNPAVDNLTWGVGLRAHFHTKAGWFRPGLCLAIGLDQPTGGGATGQGYKLIQLDLPFAF